ncbi:MAG: hypothetical protein UY21_C0004G0031 [Microgenomates group bacterium GW2011_GWA1_48_10]|nr:MAG: hypothetical protein UY21_C0004G0031 [Microgenomates group bacterium GW2011_GWA1_48_10]
MKAFRTTSLRSEDWLRDVILGGQDGLVNVLGIVLGITAASGNSQIIIAASLAAAFAEAISMGAVAYTSASAEKDHYEKEFKKESEAVEKFPEQEREDVRQIYMAKGFTGKLLDEVVVKITSNKQVWVETMADEQLGLKPISSLSLLKRTVIVGLAAIIGALIPIIPYFFLLQDPATKLTLLLSAASLFALGFYEAKTYVGVPWKRGFQMLLIGMGAALVGFLVGKIFGVSN